MWGVLASGIFNSTDGLIAGESKVFGGCCLGIVVIAVWSIIMSLIVFLPLNYFKLMRVSAEIENVGLDEVYHGGLGYYIYNKDFMDKDGNRSSDIAKNKNDEVEVKG